MIDLAEFIHIIHKDCISYNDFNELSLIIKSMFKIKRFIKIYSGKYQSF